MKAPGITLTEIDLSEIISNANDLVLACVGGATKGLIGVPVICDTENDLATSFGPPTTDLGLLTALRFLRSGSRVIYNRVADNTVATADRPIPGTSGGTPATFATGTVTFNGGNNAADGDFVTIHNQIPTANLTATVTGTQANVTITVGGSGVAARIKVSGMAGGVVGGRAVGTVQFIGSSEPNDADTVTVSDGTTVAIYEFDNNSAVTGGHISVAIGSNPYATMANLISAINTESSSCHVQAVDGAPGKTFEFDNNSTRSVAGSILVAIGANAATTRTNFIAAVNNNNVGVVANDTTVTDPQATLTDNASGTIGNAVLLVSSSHVVVAGLSGATDAVGGSSVSVLDFKAISPGSWGNNVEVVITATKAIGAEAGAFDLIVNAIVGQNTSRTPVEGYTNLNLDSNSLRYIQTVIEHGIANESPASRYIDVTVLAANGTPTFGSYLLGTGGGVAGVDGISGLTATSYVGTNSNGVTTGLQSLYDQDNIIFNVLQVPGIYDVNVINAGITLAETRQDFVFVIDPPPGLTPLQWADWHNGVNVPGLLNQPTQPLNSSYAAFFAGWMEVFSNDLQTNILIPPGTVYSSLLSTAFRRTGTLWTAVAGVENGVVIDVIPGSLEASPDAATREIIQDTIAGQRVNPYLSRTGIGVTLEGNRTLYRVNSSRARLHVRFLLNYLKAAVKRVSLQIQWKPITTSTFSKTLGLIRPIFDFADQHDAFDDSVGPGYLLICDSTNNTSDTAADDRIVISGYVRPAFVAEKIEFDLSIFRQGAAFTIK